ncbi:MAG: fused MFS/spermidine synthase [Bacteroidota bacterium]
MTSIPTWRYWLSHLWEQRLETTSSDYNPVLSISVVQGRLQLTAQDAIYSFGDYYLNFRKVFDRFDFDRLPKQANVLVLGLGLGSIPELLENLHHCDYNYVAVEIDPVIVQLANEYSLPQLKSSIEVITTDAELFLQLDQRQYDLICMDVFQDAVVPGHLATDHFLELLKARLAPHGALVYNRLADTNAHRKESREFFEHYFQPAFRQGGMIDTGGNYMLLNDMKFVD